jgi:hypothetical protein
MRSSIASNPKIKKIRKDARSPPGRAQAAKTMQAEANSGSR